MKLLLDTHCLIWLLTDSERLDQPARTLINNADSVSFSEASIWELGLKWRKGKIAVEPRRIATQALSNGLHSVSIDMESLLLSCELKQDHADPFDRLLYAQAKSGGFKLMTADRTLAGFGTAVLNNPPADS